MYTTHGDPIPGTRLGDANPPIRRARCGGVKSCPDCMLEAAAITGLDYYREDTASPFTTYRVLELLTEAGIDQELAENAIKVMEDNGILFRERKHQ